MQNALKINAIQTYSTIFKLSKETHIKNFLYPGANLETKKLEQLFIDLDIINDKCDTSLDYGFYKKEISFEQRKELFKNAFVVITYVEEKPVAANHGFILTDQNLELPLAYFGLTQNNSSLKMDLTGLMHMLSIRLMSHHFEETMVSTISIHPRIAETIDTLALDVFPSPKQKSKRPPRGHMEYAQKVIDSYAKPSWQHLGKINFNQRDFTLSIENKEESGFSKESLEEIIKAEDWMYDLFIEHKLNWKKKEDMLFIGKFTKQVFEGVSMKLEKMENSNG